jgi:hypothetical protein
LTPALDCFLCDAPQLHKQFPERLIYYQLQATIQHGEVLFNTAAVSGNNLPARPDAGTLPA